MTKFLPPKLRELFAPRPPIEYIEPPEKKKMPAYGGVAAFLNRFEDPTSSAPPSEEPIEILKPSEIRSRKRKRQEEDHEQEIHKKAMLCTSQLAPSMKQICFNHPYLSIHVAFTPLTHL